MSHGPTPHHLREQERRERPFGLSTGDTPQQRPVWCAIVLFRSSCMNGLRIVESLSRPDSMITFKLSRDRVFRQRESILSGMLMSALRISMRSSIESALRKLH